MADDAGEAPSGNLETQAISFLLDVKSNADEALRKLDAALDSSEVIIGKRLDRLAVAINENANRQNAIFHRQAEGIENAVKGIERLADTLEKKFPKGSEAAKEFSDKAGTALDKTKTKLNETGDAAAKMADRVASSSKKAGNSLEDLWEKIRKLDVRHTLIGGLAYKGLKHSFDQANETFEATAIAPKLTQMSEQEVMKRRTDLGAARVLTGATLPELKDINEEFAKSEHLGKFAFVPAADAAVELSRATGMAKKSSAELYATLKNTYNLSHEAAKSQMESMAFMSKNSGVSIENYKILADELKYVKYGLDAAGGSSEELLKSTMASAATMSRYGGTVSDTIKQVKGMTEGGMDEYMKMMQMGVMGGASSEEIMDAIASGDVERIEKLKAAGVGALSRMAGPGVGQFMARDLGQQMGGLSGAEFNRYKAMNAGVEKGKSGALNQKEFSEGDAATKARMLAESMRQYESVTELADRQLERANGMLAATYEKIYDQMLHAAEAIERAGRSAGAAFNGAPEAGKDIAGMVTQGAMLVLLLNQARKAWKSVFGAKAATEGLAATEKATASMFGRLATGFKNVFNTPISTLAEKMGNSFKNALDFGAKAGLSEAEKQAAKMAALRAFDGGAKTAAKAARAASATSAVMGGVTGAGAVIDVATQWYEQKDEEASKMSQAMAGRDSSRLNELAAEREKAGKLGEAAKFRAMAKNVDTGFTPTGKEMPSSAYGAWDYNKHKAIPEKATAVSALGAAPATPPAAAPKATVASATAAQEGAAPTRENYPRSLGGLEKLASDNDMKVTSTTSGHHTRSSLHYKGQAMDVRTEGEDPQKIASFMSNAKSAGFNVIDARTPDSSAWSGPHLHVSYGVEPGRMGATKGAQGAALASGATGIAKGAGSSPAAPMAVAATATMQKTGASAPISTPASTSASQPGVAARVEPNIASQLGARAKIVTEGDTLIAGELRRVQSILAEHTRLLSRGQGTGLTNKPFSAEAQRHNELGGGS